MSDFVQQNATEFSFNTDESWVILSPIELSIKRKIESVGVPLKDWDINIYRGVLTGYNEAFIISTEKRNEILANCQSDEERKKTEELIRPILRGRDIKRYGYDWANLWLIATFPSRNYDIEQYPAVKQYLLSFGIERLEQTGAEHIVDGVKVKARKKTNNKWFETQDSISYWEDFSKQQIVWLELTDLPKFSLVKDIVSLNTVFFMTGKYLSHIIGFLNSSVITWYFHNCLGARSGAGTNRWLKYTIELLPIPPVCDVITNLIGNKNIITECESLKINELCMNLFTLNEEEKAIIRAFTIK